MIPTIIKGECECCDKQDVTIRVVNGMRMCDACENAQNTAVQSVNTILQESRKIDESIRIKPDLYQAATVPAIELRGAIDADETIPADKKDIVMTQECFTRFTHLKKVVSEMRAELLARESELRMWQAQTQEFAGKLDREEREKYKALDISYEPAAAKPAKSPKAPKAPSNKATAKEIKEAAAKYSVPATAVGMMCVARNMKAEDAAMMLAKSMGRL